LSQQQDVKIQVVRFDRSRRVLHYGCYDHRNDMYTFGQVMGSRAFSPVEIDVLRKRLRNRRVGELNGIIEAVTRMRVGETIELGDITPGE
jgi:hypothetical protein